MKLHEALDQVLNLSDDMVIFARKPWTLNADAEVAPLESDFSVPKAMTDGGFSYFLEVSVAKEVLEIFGGRSPSTDEIRALLMHYAEHDAYPDWVYKP